MLTEFTDGLLSGVIGIGAALVQAFESVGGIFYNATDTALTIPGILIVIALAVGLIKFGLNLVLRLFTRIK